STLLQFTGPVFHWLASAFAVAVGDATWGVKITTLLARLAAGYFMYRLLRQLGVAQSAACLGALFYAGAFVMTYMQIVRSSFPQLVNFAAMPAILYFMESLTTASNRAPKIAGLALAAIVFVGSHQPTAMIFAIFMCLYILVRLAARDWPWSVMKPLLVSGLLAAIGSTYFLVPFALERPMTADDFPAGSLLGAGLPSFGSLCDMLIWGGAGEKADYAAYVGLPMLACLIAGLIVPVWPAVEGKALRRLMLLLLVLAIGALVVRGAYVRNTTLTFFFLCFASGLGLHRLMRWSQRPDRLVALICLAFVLDAAPAAIQPWTRPDIQPVADAGAFLATRSPGQRVVEVTMSADGPSISADPSLSPLAYARVQILTGPHKQDATKAHNALMATLKIAQDSIRSSGALDEDARRILTLTNVGWVVGTGPSGMDLPGMMEGTFENPWIGTHLRLADATPFVASGRIEQVARPAVFDLPPFWDQHFEDVEPATTEAKRIVQALYRRMSPDPGRRTAAAILMPHVPAGSAWRREQAAAPSVGVVDYEVTPDRVHLVVDSDGAGFLRLAHPWSPTSIVTNNAHPVDAAPDVMSMIVLPIAPGRNDIAVVSAPSVLRQVCFAVTVAGLALLAAAGSFGRRRTHAGAGALDSGCLPPTRDRRIGHRLPTCGALPNDGEA
ncbi:MAG: hypothetical protein AB7F35_14070, partial [Acetobacteraceae bacterium]